MYRMHDETQIADRFRWVACQLDVLRKCAKLSELKSALNSLPNGLDDTYEPILLGIDDLWRNDVQKVFAVPKQICCWMKSSIF
jgi:hypothetical protein